MVAQEFETVWRRVEADQRASGRSFEDDNTTESAARADYRKIAERRVKLGLLLAEIGERAQIKVSEDEVAQAVAHRARAFPGQEKTVWDYYHKNPHALAEVRAPLYEEKVADYILTQAKVTDREVPAEELLKLTRGEEEKGESGPESLPN
jgi:trigger factor